MGGLSAFSQLLAPASANGPGFLTTSAQSIAGNKTFTGKTTVANSGSVRGAGNCNLNANLIAGGGAAMLWGLAANTTRQNSITCDSSGFSIIGFMAYPSTTANTMARSTASFSPFAITHGSSNLLSFQYAAVGAQDSDITWSSAFTIDNAGVTTIGNIKVGASGTTLLQVKVYSQTITPASVAANTTAEQTFTVTGLTTADKVTINPGAAPTAGTGIVGARVSAADTLAVTYSNNTAGALTPVSSTCQILATRS